MERRSRIDRLLRQQVHVGVALAERARPQLLRCQMIMMQIGQRLRQFLDVGAVQAAAAEQQVYLVKEDVGGNASPEELHVSAGAVVTIDAGTSQLHDLARSF